MRLLVSVRSPDEALLAARHGGDVIDLKEPGAGALGGLPLATIRAIVAALRAEGVALPTSATIGDVPLAAADEIERRVHEVAACGVDSVKVGIEPGPAARDVLLRLAACGRRVVPVFIADHGLDLALVREAAGLGFAALMADTADKRAGSLLDAVAHASLRAFVSCAREAGVAVGLAGALRATHADALAALAPDFAGFRSAVTAGDRAGALDAARLRALRWSLRGGAAQTPAQALMHGSPEPPPGRGSSPFDDTTQPSSERRAPA